jgi:hypothetical protein
MKKLIIQDKLCPHKNYQNNIFLYIKIKKYKTQNNK